ncbi:MAG: hypothetical protein PHF50_01295 [Patescibacteria group bacterium]|nr:hypothetical protein [Patescibacteria group bacterium]
MIKKLANIKFILIFLAILMITAGFILAPKAAYNASGRIKTYYSGDSISYNGRILIASTNMKGVEIFEVKDNKISLLKKFSSFDAVYSGKSDFNDVMFKIEAGKLYLILSDGRYIYKYDLADINNPLLVAQIKDNAYDWFLSLGRCGDNLVSQGTKGIKIWDNNLNVIYSNPLTSPEPKNTQLEPTCKFIFNINGDKIDIINRFGNYNLAPVNISASDNHYRKILFNNGYSGFYVVDDSSIKQFNYEGKILNSFNHISKLGYDAVDSSDPRYIYFSDGVGVVKLLKDNLKPFKWAYTTDLGGVNGWAMMIFSVKNNEGEKLVVFNNSNILVLDENLKKVDSYAASEPDNSPAGLAIISFDKNIAFAGESIIISGQGFAPNEDIKISLADNYFYAKTDGYGKFSYVMLAPLVKSGLYNLKVDGLSSKRTYSTSFRIINE